MRLNTTLMTSAALVGLLATTPVLAQDATLPADDTLTQEVMPEADSGADVAVEADLDAGVDTGIDAGTAEVATDMDADVAADGMADVAVTADSAAAVMAPEGYVVADITTFTVDQLLGVDIYGPTPEAEAEAEFIGNVTDLVLADDQAVSEIITDVGGFLGIGQKSVAIPAAQFTLFSDVDGNLQGHVTMTRDEIEALPEYVPPVQ